MAEKSNAKAKQKQNNMLSLFSSYFLFYYGTYEKKYNQGFSSFVVLNWAETI